ncbi:tetratricopeptide repeat protein [Alienimonas californiensis]|uniref:tetratricopeptide repeat protein n=1 Tax=Alienimonas californiensis TaxID=2527989 RepID=UPI0011A7AB47|nr:tetratricopeptide repeat protein [Alienimonas californiensis]
MSVRPSSRPTDFARRASRVAVIAGACGAAGLAGCGAAGANLAENGGGTKSWWSPPALFAKAGSLTPPGLVADPVPATRNDLENPAALDLAYANLRSNSQVSPTGRDDAEEAYRRVLKDDPKNVEALIGLARLIETGAGDRPGELDEAEDAYRKAVDAAPADARPLLALGRFQADRGRWGESAATYGLAAKTADDTKQRRTARHGLAVATAMSGDIEGSREHFVASVGEASAHFNVAELYRRAGDRQAALREFRLAAALNTGDNPQLAQVDQMIAALEAVGPMPGPANALPATAPPVGAGRESQPTRLAATPTRPPVDPFAGDPSPYVDPPRAGRVLPASSLGGGATAPAVYSTPQTPPAFQPPPAGSGAYGRAAEPASDAAVPPPWPHAPNG